MARANNGIRKMHYVLENTLNDLNKQYEVLAQEIIKRAVKDLKSNRKGDAVMFFGSRWFELLCLGSDPDYIRKRIETQTGVAIR